MTNEQKIDALTGLLTDVMHTLELKQYLIEDPTESYKCETEADEYHQQMMEILHSDLQ
jgi:non-homologous end joining protein Ku